MQSQEYKLNAEQRSYLFEEINNRSDRIFSRFLIISFLFGIMLATFYDTWVIAIGVGGLSLGAYFSTKYLLSEGKLYQYVGASILAVFMAQFIYQMHGLFEMHFYAFVACTLLITYANWRLQVPLFILIVGHHAIFAYLQFVGVEGVYFTQLPYMDLATFAFHAGFAAVIIFMSGMWGYFMEKRVIQDGIRALQAEETLQRNLELAESIKTGSYDAMIDPEESDELGKTLINLSEHLRISKEREDREKYIQQGISHISGLLSEVGAAETTEIAKRLLSSIAKYLNANQGTFFLAESDGESEIMLQLVAGYAFQERKSFVNRIKIGEGLVGQAALERSPIVIQNIPEDYISIGSSIGHAAPSHVIAWPLMQDQELAGVMEFATFGELTAVELEFLEEVSPRIASALAIAEAQRKTQALLETAEILKTELQGSNSRLEEQAERLKSSEADLKAQQARLVDANTELEAQTSELEDQKKALVHQNDKISRAQEALAIKAEELEIASKYKSEFLANMSHELRTPLNSILILANVLANNKNKRLDEKEVTHAQVIHKAGTDLLTLINDILDLSKIESGKLDIIMETVSVEEVSMDMEMMFRQVAIDKGVNFEIRQEEGMLETLASDRVRLEQILKNLLSNAFKFTSPAGTVSLKMYRPDGTISYQHEGLDQAEQVLAFSVTDSGIGIPKDKQQVIFEAFSQADGSTSRKFGGTGLGLSICVQLSKLLGGKVIIESEEGVGSTFTLYLPATQVIETPKKSRNLGPVRTSTLTQSGRKPIKATVLSVEDQELQSEMMVGWLSEYGMDCLQAFDGSQALDLLDTEPEIACVLLDMNLPDMSGLDILRKMKTVPRLAEVPVIIHTSMDLSQEMQAEIIEYTDSVVLKTTRSSDRIIDELYRLLEAETETTDTSTEAEFLESQPKAIEPVGEQPGINTYPESQQILMLKDRKILVVDDDMRNIFAVSAILESFEMEIETACNGKEALTFIQEEGTPDIVLMDIMMPEMDGYEATRHIRGEMKLTELPIIAVTAKAMQEDRAKCLEAGATAYLPKPIDTDRLINLMCSLLDPAFIPVIETEKTI